MKGNEKLLSICCLGYNHAEFLQENLDSIKRIAYPHIEVIVVDDGSTDNSVELLKKIQNNFPFELKIIAQENTGNIGKNLNNAIHIAKGELITFISLDDVFNANTISKEINMMNDNHELAFVASSEVAAINNDGYIVYNISDAPIKYIKKPSVQELLDFEYSHFGSFYIQGCIFRKLIIEKIYGFDEDIIGDDIVLRTKLFRWMLSNQEWNYEIITENSFFYRQHDSNIHKNSVRQIKIVTEYLEKYWPKRDDPEILIDWVERTIRSNSYSQYLPMFSLNNRVANLLAHPVIQRAIEHSIIKEYKRKRVSFYNFLIKKERIKNKRNVTILNIFNFSYVRKNNKPKGPHYFSLLETNSKY